MILAVCSRIKLHKFELKVLPGWELGCALPKWKSAFACFQPDLGLVWDPRTCRWVTSRDNEMLAVHRVLALHLERHGDNRCLRRLRSFKAIAGGSIIQLRFH